MPPANIFNLLANNPNVLNASSRRLPDGFFLVEVLTTKEGPANARSGSCFIVEFVVVSTGVNGANLRGQKFSFVPKLDKSPEAATRDIVAFVAACEGRTVDTYAPGGNVDAATLTALIQRAFQQTTGTGANVQPLNPYRGRRVFVRTEERPTKSGFKFVRHEWSPATEVLARQHGCDWPSGSVAPVETSNPNPAPQPAAPNLPGYNPAGIAVTAVPTPPAMPPAPAAPWNPPPAPAMTPPAPPAPMMPPPPPAPGIPQGPRPVENNPGWVHSVKVPGWWGAGSDDPPVPGTQVFDPATGTVHRY